MARHLDELDALAPAGYTAGLHIRFAAPLLMFSTYPQEWKDLYAANAYSLRDPLVFWGISRTGVTRWSEMNMPDPFGILKQGAEHGLVYGAVASCGTITSRSVIGVSRSDREFDDAEIAEVARIANDLHVLAEPPAEMPPDVLEAVRLAASGVSEESLAAGLGISPDAFEGRLAEARDLLGATTTAEAIRMARTYRLL